MPSSLVLKSKVYTAAPRSIMFGGACLILRLWGGYMRWRNFLPSIGEAAVAWRLAAHAQQSAVPGPRSLVKH